MIIMNTVNSDQVVAVGNPVTNFLVPVVLKRGCLAGVCFETIHMTTTEVKPKKKCFFLEREKKYPSVVSRVSQDFYDPSD